MMRRAASQTLAEAKASDSWASTSATPAAFFGGCGGRTIRPSSKSGRRWCGRLTARPSCRGRATRTRPRDHRRHGLPAPCTACHRGSSAMTAAPSSVKVHHGRRRSLLASRRNRPCVTLRYVTRCTPSGSAMMLFKKNRARTPAWRPRSQDSALDAARCFHSRVTHRPRR